MKSTSMICKSCCAPIPKQAGNAKYLKCEYCGTEYLVENDFSPQEIRYVDEARIKETAFQEKVFETERADRLKETEREKKHSTLLLALCIVSVVLAALTHNGFFSLLFLLAFIIFITDKTSGSRPRHASAASRTDYSVPESDKNKWIAFTLCLFFGIWGFHYFYVKRIGKGILYIFTFGLFGIGILVDLIFILVGKFKDADDRFLL